MIYRSSQPKNNIIANVVQNNIQFAWILSVIQHQNWQMLYFQAIMLAIKRQQNLAHKAVCAFLERIINHLYISFKFL